MYRVDGIRRCLHIAADLIPHPSNFPLQMTNKYNWNIHKIDCLYIYILME